MSLHGALFCPLQLPVRITSISVLFLSAALVVSCSSTSELTSAPSEQTTPPTNQDTTSTAPGPAIKARTTITVMAVGDIMLGTDFPEDHLPPAGQHLLSGVSAILKSADVTFGNYEGTLMRGGEPAKRCQNPRHCYVFRTPPEYAEQLRESGFDVISLANNHARDFGDVGRLSSMTALQQAGIQHSGLEGDFASWQVNGKRIGLIAFAPFRGANNPLAIRKAQETVRAFKGTHDLVMISMHMGAEGEEALHVPFTEEYYHGENRGDIVLFSHSMVEAGADLILGHGPHVPRALELYKGRLIAYSLGNFCTYYGINVRGKNGLAPILSVTLFDTGEFKTGKIISARQIRPDGPILDPSNEAARLMAELTRADFPATPLEISPDGLISLKTIPGQE